jgi:hypothetical protein
MPSEEEEEKENGKRRRRIRVGGRLSFEHCMLIAFTSEPFLPSLRSKFVSVHFVQQFHACTQPLVLHISTQHELYKEK